MKKISIKSIVKIVARITVLSITALAPMGAQAQKTKFIKASKTVKLVPGQKLKTGDFDRKMRPYTIQRLTDRVYWVEVMGYQSTVLVGNKGVLVA